MMHSTFVRTVLAISLMLANLLPMTQPAAVRAAPPTPVRVETKTATPAPAATAQPTPIPPQPDALPPAAQEARVRQAAEAALQKYADSYGPRYQMSVADVIVDGDWAVVNADMIVRDSGQIVDGQGVVLIVQRVNDQWQAVFPEEAAFESLLLSVPATLIDDSTRSHLQAFIHPLVSETRRIASLDLKLPWPAPQSKCISGYGYEQGTHKNRDRFALDFGMAKNDVVAVAAGKVWKRVIDHPENLWNVCVPDKPCPNGYGNYVIIDHGDGVKSLYAHLNEVSVEGDVSVGLGTKLGVSGNSGYSKGPHLHFSVFTGSFDSYDLPYKPEPMSNYTGFVGFGCTKNIYYKSDNQTTGGQVCSAPTNGVPRDLPTLNNRHATFTWTPPSCGGLDGYTFRVANHSNLDAGPWIPNLDFGVSKDATSVSVDIPAEYERQTLYWAIWAHNSAGYSPIGGPWSFRVDTSAPPPPPPPPTGDWQVEYFRNKDLNDRCATGTHNGAFVFRDWGEGAPAGGCSSDNWSARFTRRVHLQAGNYTFALEADDWGRFYVNSDLVVNKWNGASQHYEGRVLSEGDYDLRIEFADTMGNAKISAWWWGPGYDVPHEDRDTNQWYANYWLNPDLYWDPMVKRNEGAGALQHNWGDDGPGWNIPSDKFSAKFRRRVYFECGRYRFDLNHDDGARLRVDDELRLDRWGDVGAHSSESL